MAAAHTGLPSTPLVLRAMPRVASAAGALAMGFLVAGVVMATRRRVRASDVALLVVTCAALAAQAWLLGQARGQDDDARGSPAADREAFSAGATAAAWVDPKRQDTLSAARAAVGAPLAFYATALAQASAPNPTRPREWRDLVSAAAASGGGADTTCDGAPQLWTFAEAVSMTPGVGIALGANSATGPEAHTLGLPSNQAYAVFVVFQPTGGDSSTELVLCRFDANSSSSGNHGFSVKAQIGQSSSSDVIAVRFDVQVGATTVASSANATLDLKRRYLLAAVKDHTTVALTLVDLDAAAYAAKPLLSSTLPLPSATSVAFANVPIALNPGKAWSANALAFGIATRAIPDTNLLALYDHYRALLREYDPAYRAMQAELDAASALKACPFDAATCAACASVTSWPSGVVTSGGAACLRAIDKFCQNQPGHGMCECWNVALPSYSSAECAALRAMYRGESAAAACPAPAPAPAHLVHTHKAAPTCRRRRAPRRSGSCGGSRKGRELSLWEALLDAFSFRW